MAEKIHIAGYTIERKLGQGGMASVFLAIQHNFEREVALKVMSPLLNSDPTFTTRFIREARIIANLRHASIVPVYDVGEHHPFHYLSMEYLPGGDLKQRILKGRCEPSLFVDCCIAICGALDVAHRKGFVHRDIKPENILFREDNTPVLTDFGIARALDRGASLTVAGMIVGTPSYMSPEQVRGVGEVDGRSDLYSLGIVCYEMLTGTVPFRADSSMSVALKHLSDPMPPLPSEFGIYQHFINRLTAKDPAERYATAADAAQALRTICRAMNKANATVVMQRPAEVTEVLPAASLTPTPPPMRSPVVPVPVSAPVKPAVQGKAPAPVTAPESPKVPAPPSQLAIRTAAMLASARAALPKIGESVSKAAGSAHTFVRERLLQRAALPWVGGGVAVVAIAVIGVVIARSDLGSKDPVVAVAAAAPAPVAPAPVAAEPVAVGPTEAELAEQAALEAAALVEAEAAAAKQKVVDARERKKARQRLEEIDKENQAIARRQEDELVQRLLAAARQAYAVGAYTLPAGDSAADRYREILRLRPNHADATAGLRKIADLRAEEARRALAVSDADKARRLIADLASLQPDHASLTDLQVAMATLEGTPQQQDRRQTAALERANRYIGKAYKALDRKPFDQKAASLASDEYDNAVAQMPMAPDLPALKERIMNSYSEIVRSEIRESDTKGALRMLSYARKRKWMNAELEELELSARQTSPAEALGSR